MNNSKKVGTTIGSIALGTLAGVAIGILFAPRKGTKTRNKISGGAKKITKDLKRKMVDEAKDFRKTMNKGAKNLKNRASKLEDMVEERIESASSILKENANALLHLNEDHQIKK
jgi:gas vesicle protein